MAYFFIICVKKQKSGNIAEKYDYKEIRHYVGEVIRTREILIQIQLFRSKAVFELNFSAKFE